MLVTILSRLSTTVDKKASVIRALDADWVKKLSNIACNNINGKRRKEAKAEALRRHHTGMNLATFSFRCPNKGLSIPVTLEVCKRARAVDEFLRQVRFPFRYNDVTECGSSYCFCACSNY